MKKYDDVVGELFFDYGWVKPIGVRLGNQIVNIPCVFAASKHDDIDYAQKQSYLEFINKQEYFERRITDLLKDYIVTREIVSPQYTATALLFQRDGSFGLLLECDWDLEHGIAVILAPNEEVCIQNHFL